MSIGMIDDGDGWKVPEHADRARAIRTRLLQAGIAREILAIPATVSAHARKLRITKAKDNARRFYDQLCQTTTFSYSAWVVITDRRLAERWFDAGDDATQAVDAALAAGDDLTAFLLPHDAADTLPA
jgi:hypothetical protein